MSQCDVPKRRVQRLPLHECDIQLREVDQFPLQKIALFTTFNHNHGRSASARTYGSVIMSSRGLALPLEQPPTSQWIELLVFLSNSIERQPLHRCTSVPGSSLSLYIDLCHGQSGVSTGFQHSPTLAIGLILQGIRTSQPMANTTCHFCRERCIRTP